MPVEIRELIIRTEIRTGNESHQAELSKEEVQNLRSLILEACKRMIADQTKRKPFKR